MFTFLGRCHLCPVQVNIARAVALSCGIVVMSGSRAPKRSVEPCEFFDMWALPDGLVGTSSLSGVTDHQQWPELAQAYQRSFARLCAGTVDSIVADLGSPASGQLLDAGCGTGNVSRATARRGWTVTALDIDAQMLEVGRAESGGLPIRWVQSALPQSGLRADAFDAVVANFVVNNVPDPRAAARELARVVRPGGVVAFTAWVSERATHIGLILEAFQAAGLPEPRLRRPAEVDFERTVGGLTFLASRFHAGQVQGACRNG